RNVAPVPRSRTKMSSTPLVSPLIRFEAAEPYATNRPSTETDGEELRPLASVGAALAISVEATTASTLKIIESRAIRIPARCGLGLGWAPRIGFQGALNRAIVVQAHLLSSAGN